MLTCNLIHLGMFDEEQHSFPVTYPHQNISSLTHEQLPSLGWESLSESAPLLQTTTIQV